MEKLNGKSMDLRLDSIEKVKELFPNVISEGKIDFDILRTILGDEVDDSKEKYQFTWNGKIECIKTAQSPSTATLRPCKEKSKDWDTTENLYIEGDNLEVLKQLQKTYYGKIKMIYIDPPYNTGNDYVYKDDFKNSLENYKEQTQQAQKTNPETSGRFHSDWLSMMYPRLLLARNLLKDSGVLFMSIDENEVANAKKICEEVFGINNCLGLISNTNNPKGRSDDNFIATAHEYILACAKQISCTEWFGFEPTEEIIKRYNKIDEEGKAYREIDLRKTGEMDLREDRPNMFYYFYYNQDTGVLYPSKEAKPKDDYIIIKPQREDGKEGRWRWGFDTSTEKISELIPKYMPSRKVWGIMQKDYLESRDYVKPTSSWTFKDVNSERGTEEFVSLGFDKRIFPKPKPISTIERCIRLASRDNDIIMDFFSGSATSAHSVMRMNCEDRNKRKFIMVQLPEACDESSEAYKEGYHSICEIGEERIRRAGESIKSEWMLREKEKGLLAEKTFPVDIGFKVFKLDSTNINPWDNTKELDEQTLFDTATVFKSDRSKEDILFEIMLKYGVFDQQTSEVEINGKILYRVGRRHMIVCLEDEVDENDIEEICELQPRVVVFKEDGFKDDNAKINAEYNLKTAGVEDVRCI